MANEAEVDQGVEDAAALEAFNQVSDPNHVPTATPELEREPEPKKPEPEIEYAQITKAELADLMAKAGRVDNAFGEIGGIKRVLTQLQATPSGQPIEVTAEDFAELREEFPELAELQAKGLNKILAKMKGGGDLDAVNRLVTEKVAEVRQQAIDASLDAVVGGDWTAEVNSDGYKNWIATQPQDVKALEASDSVRDAARLLRLFKSYVPPKPDVPKTSTRKQQLEAAAATPKGTGGGHQPNPNTDEAAQAAFDAQFT